MSSKRLVIAAAAVFMVSLFLIPPALACYYPGPAGSSITVTVKTCDGTPIPGACVILDVYNGSKKIATESGSTDHGGQFTFPLDTGNIKAGLTYKVYATYDKDEVGASCNTPKHTSDTVTFCLSKNEHKQVALTISGVTVSHGGSGATATACPPKNKPGEGVDKPPIPKGNHSAYPPMAPGGTPGMVSGVILASDGETPICGAYVAIASASDPNVEYSCTYTDGSGFYIFYNVNSTADAAYKIYVSKGCDNVAYSQPFGVGPGDIERINLVFAYKDSGEGVLVSADEPVATATPSDAVPSATPVPTTVPEPAAMSMQDGGLLGQITGFIGAVISSILPGI